MIHLTPFSAIRFAPCQSVIEEQFVRVCPLKSNISKIQLLVYDERCVLIGWATTSYMLQPTSSEKRRLFGGKKGLKSSFK